MFSARAEPAAPSRVQAMPFWHVGSCPERLRGAEPPLGAAGAGRRQEPAPLLPVGSAGIALAPAPRIAHHPSTAEQQDWAAGQDLAQAWAGAGGMWGRGMSGPGQRGGVGAVAQQPEAM